MKQHNPLKIIRSFSTSRRLFLKATAVAGTMSAVESLSPGTLAGLALGHAAAQEGGDEGVLKYALTLENLKNSLYRSLVGGALLSGSALDAARTFGGQEGDHVRDLTTALQDLQATNIPQEQGQYNFPLFQSQAEVLDSLLVIEDLASAAYLGAAPLIQSGDILSFAVQTHTVEAEHATGARLLSGQNPLPFAFATPLTSEEVLRTVAPILGTALPDAGVNTAPWKVIGIAGGVAAAAAGVALARGNAAAEQA
jgi:hypothetical protein